jgi:hypothetical protein
MENRSAARLAIGIGVITLTFPTFILFQAVTCLFVVPLLLGVISVVVGVIALRRTSTMGEAAVATSALLFVLSIVVPCGLIAYANRSRPPVLIVVPDGYRGPVRLIIDPKNGVDMPLENGVYTYCIPNNGRLVIRDADPFRHWHTERARYANGKSLPSPLSPETVGLRSLSSGSTTQGGVTESYIRFFVGTAEDVRKASD